MKFIILNSFLCSLFPSQFLELLSPCSLAIWLHQLLTHPLCLKCSFPYASLISWHGWHSSLLLVSLLWQSCHSPVIWFGPSSLNPAVPQGQGAAAGGVANLVAVMVQLKPCPCENLPEPSFEVSRFFPPDFSTESLHRAFIQGWIGVDAAGDGKAGGVQSLACDFVSPVFFSASILYKEQIHAEKRDSFLSFFFPQSTR